MKKDKTSRGFSFISFKDSYGINCSLQKSSSIESKIWLGCDEANMRALIPGKGWTRIDITNLETVSDTRMHLNRKQVLNLLPYLIKFVITGSI